MNRERRLESISCVSSYVISKETIGLLVGSAADLLGPKNEARIVDHIVDIAV